MVLFYKLWVPFLMSSIQFLGWAAPVLSLPLFAFLKEMQNNRSSESGPLFTLLCRLKLCQRFSLYSMWIAAKVGHQPKFEGEQPSWQSNSRDEPGDVWKAALSLCVGGHHKPWLHINPEMTLKPLGWFPLTYRICCDNKTAVITRYGMVPSQK